MMHNRWLIRLQDLIFRIRNRIGMIFQRIRIFFTQKPETGTQPAEPAVIMSGLDADEPYDRYSASIHQLDGVVVKLGLHSRVSASHKYMYEMGRRDGALGIKMNISDIAQGTATALLRHISVILKGKISALKAKLDVHERITQDHESIYNLEKKHYDNAKYHYRHFPKQHSILLFFIYLIISIALITADLPLALKLIQNGFDLEGPGFADLFKGGMFWKTLAANWETTVTAIGIACCTVYIKFFYDEFVATPFGNNFISIRNFYSENDIGLNEGTDQIRSETAAKRKWKIGLLVITLLTILVLAIFRLDTAAANDEGLGVVAGLAFVFITMLFPVIGGVCVSYALNNLQNRIRLMRIKRQYKKSSKNLMQCVHDFVSIKSEHEDLLAAMERLGDDDKTIEEYKNYLTAYYQRGYAIGGMQPDKYAKEEDFFSRIEAWRDIAISRKINYHIEKFN